MNTIALLCVLFGILSAILIAKDVRQHPQSMKIMNSVWILTGLWAGLFGMWAYFTINKKSKSNTASKMGHDNMKMDMPMPANPNMEMKMNAGIKMDMPMTSDMPSMAIPHRPKWQSVVVSTLHCGAGCTLADIIGEWFLLFFPLVIGGSAIFGGWAFDYVLALIIGVYFQYAAIRSMRKLSKGQTIWQALKADFFSLTAWQIGMYGCLAIVFFGLMDGYPIHRTSWAFWFIMQIAMFCGFLVALPVNIILLKLDIKKAM